MNHPWRLVATLVLALALGASTAGAQTLNQQGIARLNADAQTLWSQDGIAALRQAAQQALQKLVGVPHPAPGHTTATIIAVNSLTLDCPSAPGYRQLDGHRIAVRVPLEGSWRLSASVAVHVSGGNGRRPIDETFEASIEVKDLRARLRVDVDSSDPAAPRIVAVRGPDHRFKADVDGPRGNARWLGWLERDALEPLAFGVAQAAAQQLSSSLHLRITGTPALFGADDAALEPTAPADLEGAAAALDAQLRETKMPYGSIFDVRFAEPYEGTWEDSLRDPALRLEPRSYEALGDSVINSGRYLAALAYRNAVTRDPASLAEVAEALRTTRTLLTMKGQPGNLNRLILPVSALPRPLAGDEYVVAFDGVDYVASDYISRGCYFAILFGLATAWDLLDDEELRDDAREQLEMAIDHLLANNWTWRKRDGSLGERWQGALDQQYAWLLAAARVNPTKYGALLEACRGITDLLWAGAWTAVMDPYYDYYKFELGGGSLHVILRYETDPVRWQRAYQAMAIQRRFIGHHQNALFNACYVAADPASRAALGAENTNLLSSLLRAPRRRILVDLSNDPTVELTHYTPTVVPPLGFLAGPALPRTEVVKKIGGPHKRVWASYRWDRSPHLKHDEHLRRDPHVEGPALDFLLAYWASRYYGAIAGPRAVGR